MPSALPSIIQVHEEKCVNCQACIQVCPVKFCNNGAGDTIKLNAEMCIGCGLCITACTHEARSYLDDFDDAMARLRRREPTVAIVAPSIATNFPNQHLQVNGWLKSIGVEAVFDVSFGAELTIASYIDFFTRANPKTLIASPCPSIVTYIEMYHSELLKYLAPTDTPMGHTIKMIRRFYPQYAKHHIFVASPCLAKRREFAQTTANVSNVTYRSLERHFEENGINLSRFDAVDFANDPAERAVLFSTPGGLLRTISRDAPALGKRVRRIEGVAQAYPYLERFEELIEQGFQPLLVDCLNCEKGCNGGTGTNNQDVSIEELEYYIERRSDEMQARYRKRGLFAQRRALKMIQRALKKYWEPGLYARTFQSLGAYNETRLPGQRELQAIYKTMRKEQDADFLNCNACGYVTCEGMATAIFNGLNKAENCHHFRKVMLEEEHLKLREKTLALQAHAEELQVSHVEIEQSNRELHNTNAILETEHGERLELTKKLTASLSQLEKEHQKLQEKNAQIEEYTRRVEESNRKMEEAHRRLAADGEEKLRLAEVLSAQLREMDRSNKGIAEKAESLAIMSKRQSEEIQYLMSDILSISRILVGLNDIVEAISDVAESIDLLALNASIVAAQAGDAGRAFAVVAHEVKRLAESSRQEVKKIIPLAEEIHAKVKKTNGSAKSLFTHFQKIDDVIHYVSQATEQIASATDELVAESTSLVKREQRAIAYK